MRKIKLPTNNTNFTTDITIANQVFNWQFRYNNIAKRWSMTVLNENGETVFSKIFLATGINYADIFHKLPERTLIFFDGDETDPNRVEMYVHDEQ